MSELDHDKYIPPSASSPRVPNVSAQPTKFAPQFSPARRSPPLQDKAIQDFARRGEEFRQAGTRKAPVRRPSLRTETEAEEEAGLVIQAIPDGVLRR
jgi:hypothetical protein